MTKTWEFRNYAVKLICRNIDPTITINYIWPRTPTFKTQFETYEYMRNYISTIRAINEKLTYHPIKCWRIHRNAQSDSEDGHERMPL